MRVCTAAVAMTPLALGTQENWAIQSPAKMSPVLGLPCTLAKEVTLGSSGEVDEPPAVVPRGSLSGANSSVPLHQRGLGDQPLSSGQLLVGTALGWG